MTEDKTDKKPDEGNADGGGSEAGKTFTQDQLDAILKKRIGQAKSSTTTELLEALGVDDVATATKTIKDAEAVKLAQMSELEKAQSEITLANEAVAKMQAEMDATKATAAEALLRSAVLSAASGFNDPNDAWVHIDRASLEVQSDGTYKGIAEAIKALTEAKPYLVKAEKPSLGTPITSSKAINEAWQNQQTKPDAPRRPTIRF